MSISLVKYKDLALKVIYYTKKRHLGTKIFFAKSKFQEVLLYFERNLKDSQTFLKSSYFLNGKQIFPNDILLYFCTVDPNLRLVEEDLFIEIEELEHIDDSSEPIYEKLLKPLVNPFKLILLNIKEGILQMVDFPKEKIKDLGFDSLVDNNFASCNSLEALFISHGKNFWIISNKNFVIERKEMPISKEKHSMYYVLSNNSIFIAGGNSEDSFYYDINRKEFVPWGKMNGIQEKPALIQYGDFLYSFNSFNSSGIYFERTKLTSPAKKWEKLIPQSGDQESGFFYNKLYGVSKCSGGNILFAGGINNQLRTFVYNLRLNVLYININKDESVLLTERTFYKIDHNFNIAITQNIEKDHIIAIVNKNSKSLNLLPFEQIGNKTRNKLLQFDNPRNRLPGNLVIQCRYMSIKEYENFLKQKEASKKKLNDVAGKKDQKKLGDKNEPFKFNHYRNKTPLALERISEGKSEEENDEDEFSRNKSSSAKKEKRKLDLDFKVENMGKFNINLFTQKFEKSSDKKEKNENSGKKLKSNNKDDNNGEKDIYYHSDLEPEEMSNKKNTYTESKQKNDNNVKDEKKEKEDGKGSKLDKENKNKEKEQIKEDEKIKNSGLSNNEQISKSHKLINTMKEENILPKNKNGSKKSVKSGKENNNININDSNIVQKNTNINLNNNFDKVKEENISDINSENINVSKKNSTLKAVSQTSNNVSKVDDANTQQKNKTNNTNDINAPKKIITIQKTNNNINPNTNANNANQKMNQNKRKNIVNISSSTSQKNQQNANNPFIDNNKYQNIVEKESIHIKSQIEPNINKIIISNTKTMTTVQQKKQNIMKPPTTNTSENRIPTDPNINSNAKNPSHKASTHTHTSRQSKGKINTDEQNIMKKTNSFKVKINLNQEPKKNPQPQRNKLNINLNNNNSINNTNGSLTEGNKNLSNINKANTNVVNTSNTGIKITKSINNQNVENINNNNEMNKEAKRYALTRNVQRTRKEDDGIRKNYTANEGVK